MSGGTPVKILARTGVAPLFTIIAITGALRGGALLTSSTSGITRPRAAVVVTAHGIDTAEQ